MYIIDNNIKEINVSADVLELLYNIGFRFINNSKFDSHIGLSLCEHHFNIGKNIKDAEINQQLAIDWIRKNFGIHIFLDYGFYNGFYYGVKWCKSNGDYGVCWKEGEHGEPDGCYTIEEALNFALNFILTDLIERK